MTDRPSDEVDGASAIGRASAALASGTIVSRAIASRTRSTPLTPSSTCRAAQASATALDYTPAALQVRGLPPPDDLAAPQSAAQAAGYQLTQDGDSLWLRTGTRP